MDLYRLEIPIAGSLVDSRRKWLLEPMNPVAPVMRTRCGSVDERLFVTTSSGTLRLTWGYEKTRVPLRDICGDATTRRNDVYCRKSISQ